MPPLLLIGLGAAVIALVLNDDAADAAREDPHEELPENRPDRRGHPGSGEPRSADQGDRRLSDQEPPAEPVPAVSDAPDEPDACEPQNDDAGDEPESKE